jgi:lactate dehydrogenase-like 2-hydroxyacid dehydrogenase
VTRVPAYSPYAVTEHAVALMMASTCTGKQQES